MKINIPLYVDRILKCLYKNNFDGYIVGGAVRDNLLNKCPEDYDIATDAVPEEMKKCFSEFKVIETGIKHGTLTVISDGKPIEVTTYRIDGEYNDSRHPESVSYTDKLSEDLKRRDFTINTMAYSEKTGIIDYYGGQEDLRNKVIKCIGNAYKRFDEDALRIMRALRFASVLGFDIEENTKIAICEKKDTLIEISKERLRDELCKLIMGNCRRILVDFAEVFSVVIPEIVPCIKFDQKNKYHKYDVWEHIAVSVEAAKPDLIIRLTMLFHDIDKPKCFTLDKNGQGHCPKHDVCSALTSEKIMERLRFDNDTKERVSLLIRYHCMVPKFDENGNPSEKQIRRYMSEMGEDALFQLFYVQKADFSAKNEFCLERLPQIEKIYYLAEEIIKRNDCYTLKNLAVKGNDLTDIGIEGKAVGEMLDKLLNKVIDKELFNERKELLKYAVDNK